MTTLDLTHTAKKLAIDPDKLQKFLSGDGLYNLIEGVVEIEQISHNGLGGDCREIEGLAQQILEGLE